MKKVAVLCNNRIGIPAIASLFQMNMLHCVGITEEQTEVAERLHGIPKDIPLVRINKNSLHDTLSAWLQTGAADYVLLMTFPWRIPRRTLDIFPDRIFNFHYGLLPEMAGADPVFESLRQGRTTTGVTVHRVEAELDRGAIIGQRQAQIPPFATHGLLCTQLAQLAVGILPDLPRLISEQQNWILAPAPSYHYFTKPGAADVCIRWSVQDAFAIEALIRACNPWNKGAYAYWKGGNLRLLNARTSKQDSPTQHTPGTLLSFDGTLSIQCINQTQLHVDTVFTDEGFLPAQLLGIYGLQPFDQFVEPRHTTTSFH